MNQLKSRGLKEMTSGGDYFRFSDGDLPGLEVERKDFNRCEWENMRLKEVKFGEGKITRCRFKQCYLRKAIFDRVDLTGTKFFDCDLSHARFNQSTLWYVEFFNCELDYENLIQNAPNDPKQINLRRRLLHSLRINARNRGDQRMETRLLLLELKARRNENRSIALASTKYFKETFSFEDRVAAAGRWLRHWVELLIWGYGVKLSSLLRSAVLLLFIVASLSWYAEVPFHRFGEVQASNLSFSESLHMCATTFSTIGGYDPVTLSGRLIRAGLSLSGGVFLGLFAAAAFKRIGR